MRIFDLIGALCVLSWLFIIASVSHREFTRETVASLPDDIQLSPGDTWMLLNREEEEVGFIHETRTHLDEGWLLEYELFFLVEIAGETRLLKSRTTATLDEGANLRQFNADIQSFIGAFLVRGEVDGKKVTLTTNMGGQDNERSFELSDTPRLANNAINQLVADPESLRPGQKLSHTFFDPMSLGMTQLTYTFVKAKQVEVYGERHDAYHFRQQLMGDELDIYISADGEALIQELPMRTVASKAPGALGKARAGAMRKRFEGQAAQELRAQPAPRLGAPAPGQLGLQSALRALGDALKVSPGSPHPTRDMDHEGTQVGVDMGPGAAGAPDRPPSHGDAP